MLLPARISPGRGASSVTCTSSSLVHDPVPAPSNGLGHNDEREALVIVHVAVLWFLPTVLEAERLGVPRHHLVNGGGRRDRTDDLLLAKQALSQLSYAPDWLFINEVAPSLNMVGQGGFEPPTSRLSSARSNQLSY